MVYEGIVLESLARLVRIQRDIEEVCEELRKTDVIQQLRV